MTFSRYTYKQKWIMKCLGGLLGAWVLFMLLHTAFPFRFRVPYSTVIVSAEQVPLHAFLASDDQWRFHTPIEEISPQLQQAVLAKEDQYFYWHFGVNPLAVARAALGNWQSGKRSSGASTITMQVARLLEPKPRTYFNKLLEAFRAMQLEWTYSKDEILELYLNLVPYGGNIVGVGAASYFFFQKKPINLSLAQVTTLAIVPNRPTSWALGTQNEALKTARNYWLNEFVLNATFPDFAIKQAMAEPLTAERRPSPKVMPPFAHWLKSKYPHADSIYSTIQLPIQQVVSKLAKQHLARHKPYQVFNASVLVLDNQNQAVVAYLGSANFEDIEHGGQIDAVQAVRSPGSTLKPFVYAKAFDEGLLTPQSVMLDIPRDYEGYNPKNFDLTFQGEVSASQALVRSLNSTAVHILEQLQVDSFIEVLEEADMRHITSDKGKLGLSLALGGCGTSLYELVGIYSALANQGRFTPLAACLQDLEKRQSSLIHSSQVTSPEAAYMTADILTNLKRPHFPYQPDLIKGLPKVAWKTGTSYGRRDAWSIGVTPRYTIGVWLGNVDGSPAQRLVGGEVAAPLLLDLYRALEQEQLAWFAKPIRLGKREVCTKTGLPPANFCTDTRTDFFIPLVSPMQRCEHLKPLLVAKDSSMSYCYQCLPTEGYIQVLYPNPSAELRRFHYSNGQKLEPLPPHSEACPAIAQLHPPNILSPQQGETYLRLSQKPLALNLQVELASDAHWAYWFINQRFYQRVPVGEELLANLPLGKVEVSCIDDRGRSASVTITVE